MPESGYDVMPLLFERPNARSETKFAISWSASTLPNNWLCFCCSGLFGAPRIPLVAFSGGPTTSIFGERTVVLFQAARTAVVPMILVFFAGLWTVWLMDNARLVHAHCGAVPEASCALNY